MSIKRACHRKGLFIRNNGDIFPCCIIWTKENLKICNIEDRDLFKKIENYSQNCSCEKYELIKGDIKDNDYEQLNIELSYKCQAKCAMCCIDAPNYKEKYNDKNYSQLKKLIDFIKPKEILVQGGEVLIQPKSLIWLKELRSLYPNMKFSLVTNGNNLTAIDITKEIFNRLTISIVGFQPQTYKTIMGLELSNTIKFSEEIIKNGIEVYLKFLMLPNNFHEMSLFLDWALKNNPQKISLSDAYTKGYIKFDTPFDYWNKIIDRTRNNIIKVIKKYPNSSSIICIDIGVKNFLKLDNEFFIKNNISNQIQYV